MVRTCILAAVSASVLFGVGCGSSSKQTADVEVQAPSPAEILVGRWIYDPEHLEEMILEELDKAGLDVSLISEENYEEMLKTANDSVDIRIEFKEDGAVLGYHRVEEDDETFEASWTLDGTVVTMHSEGEDDTVTGKLVDGKLEIEMPVGVEGLAFIRLIKDNG